MYWFYHEYLDEARRFRIHRVDTDTEREARKLHRQACEFRWVTHHIEPTVSSLFVKTEAGQRSLVPGHRPGDRYHTQIAETPMPDYIRQALTDYKATHDDAYDSTVGTVAQT
jgi:hypothetical protein